MAYLRVPLLNTFWRLNHVTKNSEEGELYTEWTKLSKKGEISWTAINILSLQMVQPTAVGLPPHPSYSGRLVKHQIKRDEVEEEHFPEE